MKAGDLVRTNITFLGAPVGSLGLALPRDTKYSDEIYIHLLPIGTVHCLMKRHLELVNEATNN